MQISAYIFLPDSYKAISVEDFSIFIIHGVSLNCLECELLAVRTLGVCLLLGSLKEKALEGQRRDVDGL